MFEQDLEKKLSHSEKEKNRQKDKVNEYHERAAELQDVVEKLQVSVRRTDFDASSAAT